MEQDNSVRPVYTTATPFRFVRELAASNALGGAGEERGWRPFNKEVGYDKHTNKVPYGMLRGKGARSSAATRRLRLRWRSSRTDPVLVDLWCIDEMLSKIKLLPMFTQWLLYYFTTFVQHQCFPNKLYIISQQTIKSSAFSQSLLHSGSIFSQLSIGRKLVEYW